MKRPRSILFLLAIVTILLSFQGCMKVVRKERVVINTEMR